MEDQPLMTAKIEDNPLNSGRLTVHLPVQMTHSLTVKKLAAKVGLFDQRIKG